MACSFTDPGGCLADLAGSAAGSIANSAFSNIAMDFGNAADSAVNWLWGQISGATAISLAGSAMTRDLAIVTTLAVVVATGLFIIQIIASVLRRDGGGLTRAVKGLLIAFLGSVAAIATTSLLLASVDALSAGFVQAATGDSTQEMGSKILSATAITASGNPAVVLVLALIVLGAVIVVWGAMMVRKLLIIVAAVFAPLAFAGATSDISISWVRKWIETMVALIVSKLILVIIFVIGLGVLTDGLGESIGPSANASATQSTTQTIIGALILLMGGFAPFLAIKLVHFGGDHFAEMHGQAQASLAGAQSVAAAPQKAQRLAGTFGSVGAASAIASRADRRLAGRSRRVRSEARRRGCPARDLGASHPLLAPWPEAEQQPRQGPPVSRWRRPVRQKARWNGSWHKSATRHRRLDLAAVQRQPSLRPMGYRPSSGQHRHVRRVHRLLPKRRPRHRLRSALMVPIHHHRKRRLLRRPRRRSQSIVTIKMGVTHVVCDCDS